MSIKEKARTSNTNSVTIITHILIHSMHTPRLCQNVLPKRFRFLFWYWRLSVIPSINVWSENSAEESETSWFSCWCVLFFLSFFFLFFSLSTFFSRIFSHLSSNLVQHKGMNFRMRSNMRYLALNYGCIYNVSPPQWIFPEKGFVQISPWCSVSLAFCTVICASLVWTNADLMRRWMLLKLCLYIL